MVEATPSGSRSRFNNFLHYIGFSPRLQEATARNPGSGPANGSSGRQHDRYVEYSLLISLAALIIPPLLFIFRHLDDNRLTSWAWVFAGRSPLLLFLLIFFAVLLANLLARRSFFENRPWLLFCFAFGSSSLFWGLPEVIVDASRYFTQAKHLAIYGPVDFWAQWGKAIFAWTDLPLVPFFYGLLLQLFGEKRLVLQVANTLFFAGTVMLTYALGKEWWGKQAGIYAGLLLLAFPYLFTQVPLIMADIHVMFFLVLAVFCLQEALARGGAARIIAAALALFFLFAVKYSAWLFLSVGFVIMLVSMLHYGWRPVLPRALLVAIFTIAGAAAFVFWQYEVVSGQISLLADFQKAGLKRWIETYLSTFFFQTHPFVTIAACASLVPAVLKRDVRYLIAGFLVLLFLVLQVQRIRYTLPLFPMVALLAAGGISSIPLREELKRLIVFCAVFTSLVIALWGFLPFLKSMSPANFITAGRFLDVLPASEVYVAALHEEGQLINPALSLPLLDIHTRKTLHPFPLPEPVVDPETYRTSSLRFTWEYRTPAFYRQAIPRSGPETALVVVSGVADPSLPPELASMAGLYPGKKTFAVTTGIFLSQTLIVIYHH
jgi:hypothetical protein